MSATLTRSASLLRVGALLAVTLVLGLAVLTGLLAVMIRPSACTGASGDASPSSTARDGIPADYLTLYRQAGSAYGVPWPVLAAIGAIETDHGRSDAPGVRSGRQQLRLLRRTDAVQPHRRPALHLGPLRRRRRPRRPPRTSTTPPTRSPPPPTTCARCCATPAATSARRSSATTTPRPTSTTSSPAPSTYSTDDARARSPSNARPTQALHDRRHRRRPSGPPTCATPSASPRRARTATLPAWAMAAGRAPEPVDARIYDDVVWLLRRYHLRVTRRARERPPHPRRRHRRRPHPRRRHHPARLGRLRRPTRPRPRLDPGLRRLRQPPRLPARTRDPVHRLRRLPRPRLTPHLRRRLPRPPPHLLGLPLLRHQRALPAVRMGDGLQRPSAGRRRFDHARLQKQDRPPSRMSRPRAHPAPDAPAATGLHSRWAAERVAARSWDPSRERCAPTRQEAAQ